MASLIKLQFEELPALCVVGKAISVNMRDTMSPQNPLPAFWDRCFAEGAPQGLSEHVYCPDYVGWMGHLDMSTGQFDYVVGMLMKPDCPVPGGFSSFPIEPCTTAVGWIEGGSTGEVCMAAHELTEKALLEAGYNTDGMSWCMELYNCPRYTTPGENGSIVLDYYIPCKKNTI